jgi:CRP-like cAMP-binding protein
MFLIVEGEVMIHRGAQRLATLHPQECFGEMSILDNEPRSASATALTDCLLLKVDQDHFHGILAQNPDVALVIIRTLTRRLRSMDVKLSPTEAADREKAKAASG